MTKKYRLLIDSPEYPKGTIATQDGDGDYNIIIENDGIGLSYYLHAKQVENRPTVWGLIEEPKQSFKRWRAEMGGEYFFINDKGDVVGLTEAGDRFDNYRYLIGNYFQTEQEAEAHKARQEAIGRVTHAIIEANEGWEPEDDDIMWTISWNTNGYRPLNLMHNSTMLPVLFPWTNTRGIALSIISSHKEDLDLIFNLK